MAGTLGEIQPFRYRGYVYDVETGLYYLRSRYYNSEIDRFLNSDSIIADNTFSNCGNNPFCNIDSDGQSFEWCGETYEYGDPKKRGNHRNRMPLTDYLDQIYQMINVWRYPQEGAGCSYGYVDCTGLYEFPMYTYLDKASLLKYHADGNNTDRIYESGLYNGNVNGCVGKGKITGNTELVPGMALFIYGYDQEKKTYHLLHMAVYVGDYFERYKNAVIESVEGSVVIRTLEESESIHKAKYTYCGYFRGIDYAR